MCQKPYEVGLDRCCQGKHPQLAVQSIPRRRHSLKTTCRGTCLQPVAWRRFPMQTSRGSHLQPKQTCKDAADQLFHLPRHYAESDTALPAVLLGVLPYVSETSAGSSLSPLPGVWQHQYSPTLLVELRICRLRQGRQSCWSPGVAGSPKMGHLCCLQRIAAARTHWA